MTFPGEAELAPVYADLAAEPDFLPAGDGYRPR